MSAHRSSYTGSPSFEAVCSQCATLAVTFECAEGALDDAPIYCRNCGHLRGQLGGVRKMAHEPAHEPAASALIDLA